MLRKSVCVLKEHQLNLFEKLITQDIIKQCCQNVPSHLGACLHQQSYFLTVLTSNLF